MEVFHRTTSEIQFSGDARPPPPHDNDESLEIILESQTHLYDLHTHLLGMGNTGFWIDSIIENPRILPTHTEFCTKPQLREQLCPLIWNSQERNGGAFIDGKQTAMFFDYLIEKNFPVCSVQDILASLGNVKYTEILEFYRLIGRNSFISQLKHYNLSFGKLNSNVKIRSDDGHPTAHNIAGDFTYDTVLTLSDLSKALGVTIPWKSEFEDLIQSKVEEKLGLYTYQPLNKKRKVEENVELHTDQQLTETPYRPFRRWIVFNARNQAFDVVKGITVETLRGLITVNPNAPAQECMLARAHIQNAFSMRNPDGTDPRPIDFDRFHGSFTPEFYPRRFALKDSLYSQRLDILATLLIHVLRRYQTCLPPVRYCELSIGVGDLSRAWAFDVLCSFPAYEPVTNDWLSVPAPTSFRRMIRKGYFPHLRNACPRPNNSNIQMPPYIPNVTYKFLAGFNRQTVVEHRLKNQEEALRLLDDSPDVAIHYILEQLAKSERDEEFATQEKAPQVSTKETCDELFAKSLEDLEKMQDVAAKIPGFYRWVVGLDLFGDEMGYPYCPFVAWPFIQYIRERRKLNKKFGLRIHCGENVPFADVDAGAYRHFIAHMYIVFRCLRFLQRKLRHDIRIGHGVAFARILDKRLYKSAHRKSSVLLAEMQDHAKHLLTKFVFEINITSNEYLLGQAIREGNPQRIIGLDPLRDIDARIIFATDDDGIWPIDYCPSKHPGHQSLVAEYCRAFSLLLITEPKDLREMLNNTAESCFYSCEGEDPLIYGTNEHSILSNDDKCASTIVFHPDLIKTILQKCDTNKCKDTSIFQYYNQIYSGDFKTLSRPGETWINKCNNLAPFVFISYYNKKSGAPLKDDRVEYYRIFANDDSFDKILRVWYAVWDRFMDVDVKQTSNYIDTSPNGPVFLSESSHHEQQDLPHLTNELNRNHFRDCDIRVFARQVSKPVGTIRALNAILQRSCSPKSIAVFTTKDKDEYVDSDSMEESRVTINEKPTQRTNYYGHSEEHVLYVICRHAGAATAYLHYIENQIAIPNGQTPPPPDTPLSITNGVSERNAVTDSHPDVNYQPKESTTSEQCSDKKI